MPIHSPPSFAIFKHYHCAAERASNNRRKSSATTPLNDDACPEKLGEPSSPVAASRKCPKTCPSGRFSPNLLQVERRLLSPNLPAAWEMNAPRPYEISGLVILDQDDPDALGTPLMPNAALLIHGARGAKPPQHVEIEGPLVRSCDIDSPAVESIVSHGQDCRGRPGIGCRSSCSPRAMPFLM